MLVETIIQAVLIAINDDNQVRWSLDDKIRWINEGQRFIALVRPDATADNRIITLVAGVKQTIPTDTIRFLRLYRNMGADGATVGKAVTFVDIDEMGRNHPDWPMDTADATVLHYMNDTQDRAKYYVYPAVPATPVVQVEALFSESPADVPLDGTYNPNTDVISVADTFASPLIDYVLFRLYMSDEEAAASAQTAMGHMQVMMQALGLSGTKDVVAQQAIRETLHQDKPINPDALAL